MTVLTDTEFNNFKTLIYNESGITFSATNRPILENRIQERLRETGILKVEDYYNKVLKEQEEQKVLLDSVTTNLTRFFRNQPHFDALINYIIPELVKIKKAQGKNKILVWSAGCSTGEEPYTIAMILYRYLPKEFTAEVLASDLSLKSLMVAKQGFYQENKVVGVPEDYLTAYFKKQDNGYQINPEIMSMVKFDYHNLKHEPNRRGIDILFCRNVLIYFDEAAQKAVVNRFYDAMSPKSFLFIGHSESLFGMNTKFEFLKTDWACLYKKDI
ncbi:protein-glutamate O-methyltransferase CheR [Treponema phagedenis]|uniref:protein-glutamate O-methyltransferase n=1 Tax=Treponema phagedenis TaxID=162 RepID=A0A0B7GS86_TREPH|nr:protein-glutamate O-methyltransferase CheR [Treponema phagedenis]EFW39173.1 CheR methyltransferase, SAM binding domain protein [Treponema phagedenis F0421]NVP25116.1 protein-glutamate O-methyltransferase CheR [Treponema phagedenis]QEJ94117.1 protein-glutamate O-methyltransferase CheR [Treponema phagedenis]QEJ97230.1 protein-glutamate O-methyltransferase CheR [Treponema phagedenis]QEK01872.1 protein-glutamate O-methyltransferase CheR [Treponema phagedenis]